MVNTLKVTISGSFKASDGDIESYDAVTGVIPLLYQEKAQQMVIKRYARIWIGQTRKLDRDGKLTDELKYKRVQKVREVFIDNIEDNEDDPRKLSYIGKSIMEMNFEELQDLAAAKDLSAVPLYKQGSLVHARRLAFSEYAIKVMGLDAIEYDYRAQHYNPNRFEPIKADAAIRRAGDHVADIEETLDRESIPSLTRNQKKEAVAKEPHKQAGQQNRLTLAQLKAIADSKGVKYTVTMSYEALYKKVYVDRVGIGTV